MAARLQRCSKVLSAVWWGLTLFFSDRFRCKANMPVLLHFCLCVWYNVFSSTYMLCQHAATYTLIGFFPWSSPQQLLTSVENCVTRNCFGTFLCLQSPMKNRMERVYKSDNESRFQWWESHLKLPRFLLQRWKWCMVVLSPQNVFSYSLNHFCKKKILSLNNACWCVHPHPRLTELSSIISWIEGPLILTKKVA